MNEKDFLSLVDKYKKKKNFNVTTSTRATSTSKEEEEFNKLVEQYRQNDFGSKLEAVFAKEKELDDEDLAPVGKKDDDGLDFVKAGTFEDGTSFTEAPIDLAVGGINTVADLGGKVLKGGLGFFEGVSDLILHGAGYAAGAVGLEKQSKWLHNEANIKVVDNMFKGYEELVDPYSFAGKTTQAVAEGVGQMAPIVATGGMASAAGLGKLGTTVATTALTGASSMGSGISEAYEGGATDKEAAAYGVIAGASDAMTELLFGGLGKSFKAVGLSTGLSSADDMLAKTLSSKIKNIFAKNLVEFGVKSSAEGLEEVLAGTVQAFGKSITYKKEEEGWTWENFQELLKDENLLEQFVVGALTSGVAQSGIVPGMKNGSLIEANKTGRDFITGNTQNEQAVIDAEINKRIAEAEKNGEKLTGRQKNKIIEQVKEDMEKGYISTDTIEEVLGGVSYNQFKQGVDDFMGSETYKAYNDAIAEEKSLREEFEELQKVKVSAADLGQQSRFNEVKSRLEEIKKEAKSTSLRRELQTEIDRINGLKKKLTEEVSKKVENERLSESYRELQRSTEKFQADPMKYDNENARKTVQNIVDSGIANNTNETREFVDFMAKLSADKGVVFSMTDAERLAGTRYAKDGATTNGYVTSDGEIVINKDSKKRLNSVVGHEVTHVLEGTELYTKLQEAVIDYAKKKGDYDSRLKAITELYEKHNPDADPKKELTADLVGDYLFTDRDFINKLSTEHRNVFQKIYDEIKYLVKVATAGSKEARALEKAKKMFEEAYRENVKPQKNTADSGVTTYSLSQYTEHQKENWKSSKRIVVYDSNEQLSQFIKDSVADKTMDKKMYFGAVSTDLASKIQSETGLNVENYNLSLGAYEIRKILKDHGNETTEALRGQRAITADDFSHIVDVVLSPTSIKLSDKPYMGKPAIVFSGNYNGKMNVVAVVSDKRLDLFVQTIYANTKKENLSTPIGEQAPINTPEANSGTVFSGNSISQKAENVNTEGDSDIRFSLSEAVEETGELMALHNLKTNELLKSLDLGGLPMPSIAIVKAEAGHDQYGDVSLILPKETIDPKASKDNKVYGADAWTPTYPKIEYKANEAVERKISEKYYELAGKYGYDEIRPLYKYANDLEDTLNYYSGEAAFLEDLYNSTDVMQAYLLDTGKGKIEPVQKEIRTELSDAEIEMNEFFINELGADLVDNVVSKDGENPVAHRKKYWEEHGEQIKEAYKKFLSEEYKFSQEQIENVLANMKTRDFLLHIRDAHLYRKNGKTTTRTETDIEATKNAIREAAGEGYKAWVDGLFKGIEEKSGIRNNVDYFTNNGTRRKWEALHWENTLENVVRVMKQQNQTGADAIFGAHQIFATAAKDYRSIDEIKADSHRLYKMTEEDYEAVKDSYSKRMLDIANRIMDKGERNQFIALDNAMEVIVDAVRKSKTKAGISKELKQYRHLNVTEQDVEDIVSLVKDISNMPTGYFEAKPMRAVGFDEVGVFVIPRNADVKLKQELLNRGYAIAEYDPDVEGDRQKVVNSFEEYKFSLSNAGDTSRTGGGYAVYGDNIRVRDKSEFDFAPLPPEVAPVQDTVQPTVTDTEDYPIMDNSVPTTEEEANAIDGLEGITDADVPPMPEAPYYGENEDAAPTDPFEDRDIKDVGNRKVKAYMYENPEVKPFFQEEANIMLGELQRTTKGERFYNMDVYYETNGEAGITGTSRNTSDDIAYLLDELKYSYKQIESGLRAIIEDNGKENNAVSKRIEFLLNDRLMNGYTDFELGVEIPPNPDYVNLLNEKQIQEYNDEARKKFFEVADDYAPVTEAEELPMSETTPTITEPVKDNIESIEPTQTISTEGTAIKTVKERLEAKVRAVETEIAENRRLREESIRDYDAEIAQKEAEYAAKNNKNTKAANDILRRIERLKRFKGSVDADYAKRISDLEEKATKANEELRSGESTTEQAAMRRDLHSTIIERAKEKFAERGFDFDEVLKNAKDLSTFSTVDNTPQRVMEKALGYKEGQVLADLTVNKVAQNETEGIKWLNSFTNRKKGLLAEISNRYHIKPGSKESAAAQMYAEGFYVNGKNEVVEYGDRELALDFRNAKTRENIKGLASDPRIRQIYDETLDKINESRARNAYPEIKKLDNYYLHFRAMDDTFSKLGIPFNPNDIRAKDLPTDLNGVTADLKPGQPYFSSAMHRRGNRTSFDLLGGLERYLTSAKDQIYHIDDIQTLRALRNYVADSFGQAKGLEDLDLLTEEEAQAKIEQVYNSHLSTFAKFLNEEANVIAGKTALIDRGLEGVIGRRGMTIIDTINRQVGANMVGFNVSSALTNFLAPVQAFAKTNKAAFTKAFAQTVFNKVGSIVGKTDGFIENNPTMIRRQGAERFYRTPWQKAGDAGYVLMGAVDSISTELIVRAKYNELIGKGMSEQDAVTKADKWASRLMGDRSLGQQPQLYNSKTLGILTKFQLEVRNQLDSQFYDTIQEAKVSNEETQNALWRNTKTAAKVTSTFFQLAVAQHLFGKVFESIAGYNPAFDIIEAIIKTFGWDDEEDSEDTTLDNIGQGFLSLLEDMPYSSLATGGRVPMASALPIEQLIKGKDQYGNEKSRLETVKETIPYYVLPGGYGQIKKTTQGLGMFDDSLPIAGSYTDSGNLRFPVDETPKNIAQAAIFGQYASDNARDYFDNERQPLKEKQIQEFIDVDIPIREYWDYREGLKDLQTIDEKFDYIASLDLPIDKKNILVNNVTDRKEPVDLTNYDEFKDYEEFDYAVKNPEKYEFLQSVGVSVDEYQSFDEDTKDAYTWAYNNPEGYTLSKAVASDIVTYREYAKALDEIKADKDADGKSISGSRKEKVINYLNTLDADYGEKLILFKSEYNADDTYNYEIIDYLNSRNDLSYAEIETILKKIGFTVDADGNIYW